MPIESSARPPHYANPATADRLHVEIVLENLASAPKMAERLPRFVDSGRTRHDFLYVFPSSESERRKDPDLENAWREETRERIQALSRDFESQLGGEATDARCHFVEYADSVDKGILNFLELENPDLLVLGMDEESTHSQRGWRIHSTIHSVATHAPSSVLVLKTFRPAPANQKLRVLFATDGSDHAAQAAAKLTRFLPKQQTELTLLSVVPVNYYVLPVVEPYVNYGPLEEALQGQATDLLNRTRDFFSQAGYSVSDSYFTVGDPVDRILHEAAERQIDLIVTGAHGAGKRFRQWLLGSVSSRILEYADTSVAILRAG